MPQNGVNVTIYLQKPGESEIEKKAFGIQDPVILDYVRSYHKEYSDREYETPVLFLAQDRKNLHFFTKKDNLILNSVSLESIVRPVAEAEDQ